MPVGEINVVCMSNQGGGGIRSGITEAHNDDSLTIEIAWPILSLA